MMVYEEAKLADPGITQEEADKNRQKCLDECSAHNPDICFCKFGKNSPRPATPAEPARDWWRKATDNEYRFCIHEKGL